MPANRTSFKPGPDPRRVATQHPPFEKGNAHKPPMEAVHSAIRLAKILTPEALEVAAGVMRDKDAKNADRLRAVELILDRAIGKPKQAVELTGEDGGPINSQTVIKVSFHDPGEATQTIEHEVPAGLIGVADDGPVSEGV